ncbi:MAG: hypothetical protein ACKVQR_08470 [Aquabacterium sp.]
MPPNPHPWHPRTVAGLALAAATALAAAAPDPAGRWDGVAQVPGAPQRLVVDLARGPGGAWIGSVTLPGRGVKGAPLVDLVVDAGGVRAGLSAAFPFPIEPAPRLSLQPAADGTLAGRFEVGGHVAALSLARSGPPQVDRPVPGTGVLPELQGQWRGRYELGGVPRDVTLQLANGGDGLARGRLRIVGRRTSELAVDHVTQGREYIVLLAQAVGFRIEGRFDAAAGRIDGGIVQGPFEAPLVLLREGTTGDRP